MRTTLASRVGLLGVAAAAALSLAAAPAQAAAVPADGQVVARAGWFNLWFGQKKVKRPNNWTTWTTPSRKSKARHLQAVVTCSKPNGHVSTRIYHKGGSGWRLKKLTPSRGCASRPVYTTIHNAKVGGTYRLRVDTRFARTVKVWLQNYG